MKTTHILAHILALITICSLAVFWKLSTAGEAAEMLGYPVIALTYLCIISTINDLFGE